MMGEVEIAIRKMIEDIILDICTSLIDERINIKLEGIKEVLMEVIEVLKVKKVKIVRKSKGGRRDKKGQPREGTNNIVLRVVGDNKGHPRNEFVTEFLKGNYAVSGLGHTLSHLEQEGKIYFMDNLYWKVIKHG